MKKLTQLTLILLLSMLCSLSQAQPPTDTTPPDQTNISATPSNNMSQAMTETSDQQMLPIKQVELQMAMRKLWEDHIVYTRNFIISTLANLKDVDAVTNRLLQNQDDIGNAIKPFYGEEAGNKLSKLLREHILIAAQVVKAAKANNKSSLNQAQEKWKENAEEIAIFLSDANPNLNKSDLLEALQMHLDLTTDETVARLHKDWKKDINAYDKNHDHMLHFSDTLVNGIVTQFPEKFKE